MNQSSFHGTGMGLAARSTIVYADLDAAALRLPSAVAGSIARAAKDSLVAGRYQVMPKQLSTDDIQQAIRSMPTGQERVALDYNLILLDAGALLAYAPYRSRVLLTCDPFAQAEKIAQTLQVDADLLRIRLHDALLAADKIVALGRMPFDATIPLVSRRPQRIAFPPAALRAADTAGAGILIVNNDDPQTAREALSVLEHALPREHFVVYTASTVFDSAWKFVIHLGLARLRQPGARLRDAWAGGVPILQLVDPVRLDAEYRRTQNQMTGVAVNHGRTGLVFSNLEELVKALSDLLFDALPARAVARSARRGVDTAAEWDRLLSEILQ